MNAKLYDFLRPIVGAYYRLIWGVRPMGVEHINRSGGLVLCCNHIHARDPASYTHLDVYKRQSAYCWASPR